MTGTSSNYQMRPTKSKCGRANSPTICWIYLIRKEEAKLSFSSKHSALRPMTGGFCMRNSLTPWAKPHSKTSGFASMESNLMLIWRYEGAMGAPLPLRPAGSYDRKKGRHSPPRIQGQKGQRLKTARKSRRSYPQRLEVRSDGQRFSSSQSKPENLPRRNACQRP